MCYVEAKGSTSDPDSNITYGSNSKVTITKSNKTELAHEYIYIYTGCPRRNVRDFGRVFLMLNYTDITKNTYVQSRTVTEIMAREKCGRHRCRHTLVRP